MTTITQQDFIQSIADALQHISYYHPLDYIHALADAYEREQSPAAKDAIAQILTNSRMCAEGHRPICQDTGIVVVFLKVGMDVRWDATMSLQEMVDEGVRRAYLEPTNVLRASIVADPAFSRKNTRDNTPAVVHTEIVPGNTVEVKLAAKGGGSENKTKFAMLNPSDSIVDWVLKTVPTMGAGWCPPGMLGIGIGGSAEKAMLMAKESLMEHIDMGQLKARGPQNKIEELRIELHDKINALGIGAQGLGGLSTVLDVKIFDYPTHAASKPIAMIPNCAATRHAHFTLDGSGVAQLPIPKLSDWPARDVEARRQRQARRPQHAHRGRSRLHVEGRRSPAAQRQAPHRARRGAQAHRRPLRQGRAAPRPGSTSPIASSTTSARSTRCATRRWGRRGRRRRRAWTSSPR
jgi:fumarate hydratase class I